MVGPQNRAVLHPDPDRFRSYDRNRLSRQAVINNLNQPFTNRDIRLALSTIFSIYLKCTVTFRYILQGGMPINPGIDPYPLNKYWGKNLNRLLLPAMIKEDELLSLVGCTHQELYRMSEDWGRPFIEEGGRAGSRRLG